MIDLVQVTDPATAISQFDLDIQGLNSGRVVQSVVEVPSINAMYSMHDTGNGIVINKFGLGQTGSITSDRFTSIPNIQIGHQGLAVEIGSSGPNDLHFWSSGMNPNEVVRYEIVDDPSNTDNLTIENVQTYTLWPSTTEDLYVGEGNNASPTISADGNYLIVEMVGRGSGTIRVFDLATLANGGGGDYSNSSALAYEFTTGMELVGVDGIANTDGGSYDYPVQAMASDGQHIYVLVGDGYQNHDKKIVRYDLDGSNPLEINDFSAGKDLAGDDGNGEAYEPEGLYFTEYNGKDVLAVVIASGDVGSRTTRVIYLDAGTGTSNDDVIEGDHGNNTIHGGAGDDILSGGDGDDIISDGGGADTLSGGNGDDTFISGTGLNTYDGGAGSDTVDYSAFVTGITIDLDRTTAQVSQGAASNELLIDIENVIGTDGDDDLTGNDEDNILSGGDGDDIISDGGGADTLSGGNGDDTFISGTGLNTYDGGAGSDTVDYSAFVTGITIDLDRTTAQVSQGAASNELLIDIENVIGTDGDDDLTGNDEDNILSGGDGDDIISDGGGADTLSGGNGDDTFISGTGLNTYDGGAGSDTVDYSAFVTGITIDLDRTTAQVSQGAASNELLIDIENVIGTDGDDDLTGNDEDNILSGGDGDDIISDGGGADTLSGGNGDDTFISGTGLNTYDGGAGSDTVDYSAFVTGITIDLDRTTAQVSQGAASNELLIDIENVIGTDGDDDLTGNDEDNILSGGDGDDIISDGGGADTLSGGNGDDTFISGTGLNTYDGGAGSDTVDYSAFVTGITIDLDRTTAQVSQGAASNELLIDIENVIGTDGDDDLTGNDEDNILSGGDGDDIISDGGGADTLSGGNGDDTFISGTGLNTYDGGAGSDTVDYSAFVTGITIDLDRTTAQVSQGAASNELLIDIENVIGTDGDDDLTGNDEDNILSGGDGDDIISDGGGADTLSGGNGDDTFISGTGLNTYDGGAGSDTVDYSAFVTGITIDLDRTTAQVSQGAASNELLIDIENVIGTDGDDDLTGNDEDNILSGGDGDDIISDGGGADTLSGGNGDDTFISGTGLNTYDGGAGSDTVDYSAFVTGITIDLDRTTAQVSQGAASNELLIDIENVIGTDGDDDIKGTSSENTLRGDAGDDRLSGRDGADHLQGGDGEDHLLGGSGADILEGGAGEDILDGGGGVGIDLLYGGASADQFHFDRGEGHDIVKDFENNIDTIEFDDLTGVTQANIMTFATNQGSDVLFDFGVEGSVLVENTSIGYLTNDVNVV